jgi:hypothetical protein
MIHDVLAVAGARRLALRLDGGFLLFAGGVALTLETLAHFFSVGPQRDAFGGRSWATIGFFEAHGLAIILGVLLIRAAASPGRGDHRLAAAVHLLLGGANLLFWDDAFVRMGLVPVGVVTTALHLLFLAAQSALAVHGWAADAGDPPTRGPREEVARATTRA